MTGERRRDVRERREKRKKGRKKERKRKRKRKRKEKKLRGERKEECENNIKKVQLYVVWDEPVNAKKNLSWPIRPCDWSVTNQSSFPFFLLYI